ncbi:MAG: family 78 glycoside hydrolase catalytic domain, partial [Oscillibacter sp.]|nr:family 78 glycoside hydrolase catalytic domain [Oscillibacter sp.]
MKHGVKRAFAMALTGALILGVLSGCGGSQNEPPQEPDATEATEISVTGLTVNGLPNPLGVEGDAPLFGWRMESNRTGAAQTAYQITVTNPEGAVVWDSGKVEDSASRNIEYGGEALKPQTRYVWNLAVTDGDGTELPAQEAFFETSLMDGSAAAWSGAEWIGSPEMYFDATTANYFSLDMTVQIPDGGHKAGIVFGADDYRLKNDAMNIWGANAGGCFNYEIDVTDAAAPKLNIYVVGMPALGQNAENDAWEPDFVVDIPADAIPDAHAPIAVNINTLTNINQVTCVVNGVTVDENRQLNPLGNTHDYNSFPNVASIGFAVPAGEQATYTNIALHYPGAYEDPYEVGDLFGADVGATYAIFDGLDDGVTVENAEIRVDGGADGVVAYADPSYGSAPMLRTEFDAGEKEIASARLYITAQGVYEAFLNGEKVGNDWFAPGSEEYSTVMPYQIYDVTEQLQSGANAFGVQLAEGWWSGYQGYIINNYGYYGAKQAALVKLDIAYADGSTETVISDTDNWKVYNHGPVEYAGNVHGERYNAVTQAAMDGWTKPGYDDSAWETPVVITPRLNNFTFETRYDEPGRVVGELTAVECLGEVKEGSRSYIYDMGENVMGVPSVTIPDGYVHKGEQLIFRYAEVLYPDLDEYRANGTVGMMMVENLRAAMVTDFYTATDGEQVFEPHFTFRGYRYLEITGLTHELPLENVKLKKLSSVETSATYDSSNELVNRLFKNVQNSQTSNFLSLPTDCPQRNERLGWTGDAQVFSKAASYNADVYNFYRNWLKALRACQFTDGSLPVYAPTYEPRYDTIPPGFGGVSWDAALMIIPYNLYQQTGNPAIIRDNMDAIEKYLDYLAASPLLIPDGPENVYGGTAVPELTGQVGILADWLSIDETPPELINEAVYVYLLDIAAQMADIAGRTTLATGYRTRYDAAKAKWNELYVNPDTGITVTPNAKAFDTVTYSGYLFAAAHDVDTEASYATPLRYGVFSEENEAKAVENFLKTVERANYTITSGFSGTPNLVPVLTKYGYVEEAYKLFEQTEYASWLYPVLNGATSVWERWNSYTVEGGFNGNNSMNSFDHF